MISLALLGVGRVFNNRLLEVFRDELSNANITVVCDQDATRATEAATALGGRIEFDYEKLFQEGDFDAVYIATESGKHYDHALCAKESGKHVIVEKPPALFPGQASHLAAEFRDAGLMYAVVLQNRFNPGMKILKRAYDEGRFGKLVLATIRLRWCRYQSYYEDGWHGTWEMDGGVISQQAYHHLDALQWVCGPVAEVVSAQTNAINQLEAEDTTVAVLKFLTGGLGVIECTTAARPEDFEASISVIGENGFAVVGGIALNNIEAWEFVETQPDDEDIPQNYSQDVPTGYGLSHGPLLEEILSRLERGEIDPPIGGYDAEPAIRLVHALYLSDESGGWVNLDRRAVSSRLGQQARKR